MWRDAEYDAQNPNFQYCGVLCVYRVLCQALLARKVVTKVAHEATEGPKEVELQDLSKTDNP
jgi:hypothetical protein